MNWMLYYVQNFDRLRWHWGKSQAFCKEKRMSKNGAEVDVDILEQGVAEVG